MKTLHFRSTFSKLSETFIYDMVLELSNCVGNQHVLTFKRINEPGRPLDNVHCISLPGYWHPKAVLHRFRHTLGLVDRNIARTEAYRGLIENIVLKISPDVVHAHFGLDGLTIAPVARKLNVPMVVSFYGIDASGQLDDPKWQSVIDREVFAYAHVVSLSEEMRYRLVEKGAREERTRVIRLGKRIGDYTFRPPQRVRRFLSVGRMTEKKGHFDTVNAFARLLGSSQDVYLDIVGGGELAGELDELVKDLRISEHVRLHGPMPHAKVISMMASADAFVLSSKRSSSGDCEGTPTVLMEAQASGLPCISTWHAGIPETIPLDNHHLLANEGDVEGIQYRMLWLSQASSRELASIAESGRQHVELKYNIKTEARKLYQLYESIVSS